MAVFREHTPKRQIIIIKVSSHQEHSVDLMSDFKNRCGYCDDIKLGNAVFEVDHFVPQNPKNFVSTIDSTKYSNLVYSCMSCNRAKSNKWPTNNEKVFNKGDVGFFDPCDDEYNNQFTREDSGRILPNSDLGNWMYYELKLHKPQHEILWKLDQFKKTKKKIMEIVEVNPTDIVNVKKLLQICKNFDEYFIKLSEV